MNENSGYAVFFFPQALEALGDAIKPYLQDGPAGAHVICNGIDTGGTLLEMTIQGLTDQGKAVMLELMVPGSMVRMVVSTQIDASFGFGPRQRADSISELPTIGPTAAPADARSDALPGTDAAEALPADAVSMATAAALPSGQAAKSSSVASSPPEDRGGDA